MNKELLLREFEEKWGDDLKFVLNEVSVGELFSDLSKMLDKAAGKTAEKDTAPKGEPVDTHPDLLPVKKRPARKEKLTIPKNWKLPEL